MTAPHDPPSAGQLVEAVREWLETQVMPNVTGAMQFNARVAANVLAMVEREIDLGSRQATAHLDGLRALGCVDDADLAGRIRNGEFADETGEVRADVEAFVFASVVEKLRVANPKYLR
jgi:Domain of unknown function (DUF6285)